jgi:hypothetical protein
MPGTVRIWWHDGAARDARYNDMPIVGEPELGFETFAVSATPSASGPAPETATLALVETDVGLRYRVRRAGDATPADPADCKPIATTGRGVDFIGVAPGCSISFVEA